MKSPAVQAMSRLGMARMTMLMTVLSAFMSLAVAWMLSMVMFVGDVATHLRMAFVIPFFVTPGFSYLTALSLRESRRARKDAFDMARRDPLTGVANRRAFFEFDAAREPGDRERALLYLDIDHFKVINDGFGHEGGDAVLVHLAQLLAENIRKGDLVARFGGEEFVVLMGDCDMAAAEATAQRVVQTVRRSVLAYHSREIAYTVSVGVAVGAAAVATARLLGDADTQLYVAKGCGRDTFRITRVGPAVATTTSARPAGHAQPQAA